jgi:hypothetical protein
MKPIGQTFYINEPATGVPGVFITAVDVYFNEVDPNLGVSLQVRTTENGVPTQNRLPFGIAHLSPTSNTATTTDSNGVVYSQVSGVNYAVADTTAATASRFVFETPVFVQSGTSYALVLVPDGGNPNYQIWTAEIGQTDVITNRPIYTNNDTGDLFLSSNDITWDPVITEDWKFNILTANFTSSSGVAQYTSPNEDYLELLNVNGKFLGGEPLYSTGNVYNVAVLNVSGVLGTFANGNYVYQTNGSVNVATGVVYSQNSTVMKLSNTTGAFSASYQVFNANATANATVTAVSQNAYSNSGSTTVHMPDTSFFAVGNTIYIATNNSSNTQVVSVTNIISNTSLSVNTAIGFTDPNIIYGKVLFDGQLTAGMGANRHYPDGFNRMILDNVTSTSANNWTSSVGQRLIGAYSTASAYINKVINVPYNQISPRFHNIIPSNTLLTWAFSGVANNSSYTTEGFNSIHEGVSNEMIDYERVMLSRSNELTQLPVGRLGNRTLTIQASMSSSNTKISPYIDHLAKLTHLTRNLVTPDSELYGYYLSISNTNGSFTTGESVSQGSSTATVAFANSSYMRIKSVSGANTFVANSTIIVGSISNANAVITSATYYGENIDNGIPYASRYISKTVILASTQNSEDILTYVGAYRPANTNLRVFTKIQNAQDPDVYDLKDWSSLVERTPASLLSSGVDPNDQVELIYGFPQSNNLFISNTFGNTVSSNLTVFSTSGLQAGQFVYISNANNNLFNVRQIVSISNSSTIVMNKPLSFIANATIGNTAFGTIPGIVSPAGAFLNDQNSNIVRYVTNSDIVYDSYSQFSIKIVPVASTTALVPRASDLRVLAVQA